MRKQTKLAVGLSAAALLAIGATMTSFAARGWVAEGDQWYYYDNSGEPVTQKWKSYNGNYFYLGDDGAMLTNQLVDDNGNYYFVDANGAMVKNAWVPVPADDAEDQDVDYRWYYFGAAGKAYKSTSGKTINGKKYGFDEDGKMLFGFVDDTFTILNDQEDAILDATYYYGTNEDGARHTGWLLYTEGLSRYEQYDNNDFHWFYFKSNGQKVTNAIRKIGGQKYSFDQYGKMESEWNPATKGSATEGYFSSDEDGHLQRQTWVWAEPSDQQVAPYLGTDNEFTDDNGWFYVDKQGMPFAGQTKKIKGKWYVFDDGGIMRSGLVLLDGSDVKNSKFVSEIDTDEVKGDDIKGSGWNVYFFSDNYERDGSMKTGYSIKVELADDTYTFGFDKKTGCGINGVSKNNKLYDNGILVTADSDDKYAKATVDGKDYVVSSNGSVVKKGQVYKDGNDVYWAVGKTSGDVQDFDSADYESLSKAAQAARAWAKAN